MLSTDLPREIIASDYRIPQNVPEHLSFGLGPGDGANADLICFDAVFPSLENRAVKAQLGIGSSETRGPQQDAGRSPEKILESPVLSDRAYFGVVVTNAGHTMQ